MWLLRFLGLVPLAVHTLEVERRDEKIATADADARYWRTRAEKLMDAALSRAGAIHEPTMRDVVIPKDGGAAALIASALSVTEIDSSQKARH